MSQQEAIDLGKAAELLLKDNTLNAAIGAMLANINEQFLFGEGTDAELVELRRQARAINGLLEQLARFVSDAIVESAIREEDEKEKEVHDGRGPG